MLSIVGEAGLGKTDAGRLPAAAAAERRAQLPARRRGSLEIAVAYARVAPGVRPAAEDPRWRQRHRPDERGAASATFAHPQLAPLVNAVVPGFLEETPLVQSLTGQARADATSTVLRRCSTRMRRRRFVLVLEDCHWMDSASWRLLLRVAQDYPEALIVLTSRPTADVQEASTLRALDRFPR